MITFTVKHSQPIAADLYWSRLFFDETYTERLYIDGLKFKRCETLSLHRHDDGRVSRTLRLEPDTELPAVVQKVVQGRMEYTEEGSFDPTTGRWRYRVTPLALPDKTSTEGEVWVTSDPHNAQHSIRFCRVQIEVRVFVVGSLVEQFLEQVTRQNLDAAAHFTSQWLQSH